MIVEQFQARFGLSAEAIILAATQSNNVQSIDEVGTNFRFSVDLTVDGQEDPVRVAVVFHGSGFTFAGDGPDGIDGTATSIVIEYDNGGADLAEVTLPFPTDLGDLLRGMVAGSVLTEGNERSAPGLGAPGDVTYVSQSEAFNLMLPPDSGYGYVFYGAPEGDIVNTYVTDDYVTSGDGGDLIRLSPGTDQIDGGAGEDTVDARIVNEALTYDGAGAVSFASGSATLSAVEALIGSNRADDITTGGGLHIVFGEGGDDEITGSDMADDLNGGAGDDTVTGGGGDDVLAGDGGANSIAGGDGVDLVTYADARGRVLVDLASDVGSAGFARFFSAGAAQGDTYDGIENVTGGGAADNLRGDGAGNVLLGGGVSDRLYGRGGNDTLDGGTGADALYGNLGADVMTGGPDAGRTDRYIYFSAAESGVGAGNRDIITDFVAGEDRLELGRLDADTTQGRKQGFDFIGADAFSMTAGELRFAQSGGITLVQADTDGDGAADFEIELTGTVDLTVDDFLI